MRTPHTTTGALTLTLALLLAGCGGESPTPAPYKPSTVSPSATTVDPTEMPPEAKGTTRASAREFVKYYILVLNRAGTSGQTDELRQLADPGCTACSGVQDGIDTIYKARGRLVGPGWSVKKTSKPTGGPNAMKVDVVVDVAPQDVIASPGAKPKHFPGGTGIVKHFTLAAAGDRWKVASIKAAQ